MSLVTNSEKETAESPEYLLDTPQMEHFDRWQIQFSLGSSMLSRACCLLSDEYFTAAESPRNLLPWPFDGRKILSVLEGRDYILHFSMYPAILNNDLHIVGVRLIPLNSLEQKAIWSRELRL